MYWLHKSSQYLAFCPANVNLIACWTSSGEENRHSLGKNNRNQIKKKKPLLTVLMAAVEGYNLAVGLMPDGGVPTKSFRLISTLRM